MAGETLGEMIRRLGRSGGLQGDLAQTDAQLLDRFARRRDEPAFAALVAQHGPMVLGVCRRLLHDPRDAEDAFQAAFLVLARRAAAIQRQALLSAWLYGVAWRVAVRLRGQAARRREREQPGVDLDALPADDAAWSDVRWVVHEEVQRLPDAYRSAVILCCLEGKTNEEAARVLQRPVGTVKSRLTRARELLRSRLSRRGMAISVGALGTALAAYATPASAALADATIRAALPTVAAGAAAGGVVSARAVALSQGVLRTMMLKKVTLAAAMVLVIALLGGVGGLAYRAWAAAPGDGPKAPAPAADKPVVPDAPKDDAASIQGVWQVTAVEIDGKDQDDADGKRFKAQKWTITADKIAIKTDLGMGVHWQSFTGYTIDPTQSPKAMDVTLLDVEKDVKGPKTRAIYSLDGDVLKFCRPLMAPEIQRRDQDYGRRPDPPNLRDLLTGGARPTELATKEGGKTMLLTLRREPAEKDKPKDDKEAIQGVWRITTIVMGGKEQDDAQALYEKTQRYVITADRIVIRYEIQENLDQGPRIAQESEYTYDLDPTQTPKVLDMRPQYAPYKGKVVRGVYALEGDVLKLCQDLGLDGERPKELASKEGDKTRLLTLKRVPPDEDREALQGMWRPTSIEREGKKAPADQLADIRVTFDGDKNAFDGGVTGEVSKGTFVLDARKEPRTIDIRRGDDVLPGIYRLDADALTLALAVPGKRPAGKERPTEFASPPGSGVVLWVLERARAEKEKPADKQKPEAGADAEKIQGTWVAVAGEAAGKNLTPSQLEAFLLVVTPDQLVFGANFFRDLRASYKLDPAKTPKEIELTALEGDAKWKAMKDIYRLDGDRLTLCIQYADDGPAPTEFATKPDSGLWLFHLKRWPRDDAPKNLTAEIVAPAEVASADSELKGEFVLTNKGDAAVRICTLCNGNDGLGGPFGFHYRPDWWKSDSPPLEASAKSVLALEPGKSYSFPFTIRSVHFQDRNTFLITAFYSVSDEAFAKKLDLWRGQAEAAPVLVKVSRK